MTTLGFGLAEQRAILAVLFTLVLSNAILGHSIPIDTSTATSTFSSLVLLTGFLYVARVLVRVTLALGYTILYFPFNFLHRLRRLLAHFVFCIRQRIPVAFFQEIIYNLLQIVFEPLKQGFWEPLFIKQEWKWKQIRVIPESLVFGTQELRVEYSDYAIGLMGVLERASIVIIAYISTLSTYSHIRHILGPVGLGLLLLAYISTDKFSFIVKDATHKAEEDSKEKQEKLIETIQASKPDKDSN